jgi:hypothetical protein
MEYIKLLKSDYEEFEKLLDDFCHGDNSEDNLWCLQNNFCTFSITLGQEFEILEHELNFGNVIIKDDILTCIDKNSQLHSYQIVKRKANAGDIVQIINPQKSTPFNLRHKDRFFRVNKQADKDLQEWVQPCVIVGNWCLYDDQYVVLEEIN